MIVIYVVAILLVACAFCTWFFVYRAKDEKRKKRLLSDLEKVEEEKIVKQQDEEREREKENSLEDYEILGMKDETENAPMQNRQNRRRQNVAVESTSADEKTDEEEEDSIEARFKRYEQFLRERLSSNEDDSEKEDEQSEEVKEQEVSLPFEFTDLGDISQVNEESAYEKAEDGEREKHTRQQRFKRFLPKDPAEDESIGAEIKKNLNDRRLSEGLDPLNEEDVTVISSQAKREAEEEISAPMVFRERHQEETQDEKLEFSEEDVLAIQNFDMEAAKDKSIREIHVLLMKLPPRAADFLYAQILKARNGEDE